MQVKKNIIKKVTNMYNNGTEEKNKEHPSNLCR